MPYLIDTASDNKDGRGESQSNKTNLSNLFAFRKSIGAGYLTSKGAKRGNKNTKKGIAAVRGSNYLTSDIKKAFNFLHYVFT